MKPEKIYHVTTKKKAKRYKASGRIIRPVRGFDSLLAAMAWAIKTGRGVIYEIDCSGLQEVLHKLPDHHNRFGTAWWIDQDVSLERLKKVKLS